jgi:hypothetical protein
MIFKQKEHRVITKKVNPVNAVYSCFTASSLLLYGLTAVFRLMRSLLLSPVEYLGKYRKQQGAAGRRKMKSAGTYRERCLICIFSRVISSLVHFSPVLRRFMSRCMKPFMQVASFRITLLFFWMSFLKNSLITEIGQ